MMKRILSFLLAFLMVVSIFTVPAYATDSTDVTITPTETPTEVAIETPCPTCGTAGCTSEHLNWCAECKKDECGQNHCPTCGTIDCTKEHKACTTCAVIDCTADHTNWCDICKTDSCGKTHVYCETCQKHDCGVDHNATEPTETPTEPAAAIDDSDSSDSVYLVNKGRKATINPYYVGSLYICADPSLVAGWSSVQHHLHF